MSVCEKVVVYGVQCGDTYQLILRPAGQHGFGEDLDGLVHEIPPFLPRPQAPRPTHMTSGSRFRSLGLVRQEGWDPYTLNPRDPEYSEAPAPPFSVMRNRRFSFSAKNSFARRLSQCVMGSSRAATERRGILTFLHLSSKCNTEIPIVVQDSVVTIVYRNEVLVHIYHTGNFA